MKRLIDCDITKTAEFLDKLQASLDEDTSSLFQSFCDMIIIRTWNLRDMDRLFVYCLAEAATHEKLSDKKIMRIMKNYIDNVNDRGYARLYKYIPQELF